MRELIDEGAAAVVAEEDRVAVQIADYDAARAVVGKLLFAVRKIRFTGDREGAASLVGEASAQLPEQWRERARNRWQSAGLPREIAFVYPLNRKEAKPDMGVTGLELVEADSFVGRFLFMTVR
jgi:hypothetical protein